MLKIKVPFSVFDPFQSLFRPLPDGGVIYFREGFFYHVQPNYPAFKGGVVLQVFHQGKDAVGLAEFFDIARFCQFHEGVARPVFAVAGGAETGGKALVHNADRYLVKAPRVCKLKLLGLLRILFSKPSWRCG